MRAYLYALKIDDIELLKTYPSLPLHCTIMQWFFTEATPDDLRAATANVFKTHAPIMLISHKRALFGPKENVPVYTVRSNRSLKSLHFNLLQALNGLGVRHLNEKYVGTGFRPHVSDVEGNAFAPGMAYAARYAYLVQAPPDTLKEKCIIEQIELGV